MRGSLNRLRPGALEGRTLKDALEKMIREYQTLSNLQVDLHYEWVDVDMDVMIEDTIFRVIQDVYDQCGSPRPCQSDEPSLFLRMKKIT